MDTWLALISMISAPTVERYAQIGALKMGSALAASATVCLDTSVPIAPSLPAHLHSISTQQPTCV